MLVQMSSKLIRRLRGSALPSSPCLHFRGRPLSHDELDPALAHRAKRLVVSRKVESIRRNQLFHLDRIGAATERFQQAKHADGSVAPTLLLEDRKSPLVIAIERARKYSLLVHVLIRDRHDEVAAGFQHPEPILEAFKWVDEVLEAVAAMDEVDAVVGHRLEELGVPVFPVPGSNRVHAAEELFIEG